MNEAMASAARHGFIQKPEPTSGSPCDGCVFLNNETINCVGFTQLFGELGIEGCKQSIWVWAGDGDVDEGYGQLIAIANMRRAHG
jgi:pyruvate/2-oxoacid:ferredoxin oxidoreductase beta subunit